jgi:hypothetical protein
MKDQEARKDDGISGMEPRTVVNKNDSPQCIGVPEEVIATLPPDAIISCPELPDTGILVDAQYLYWYNSDVVRQLAQDGSAFVYTHADASPGTAEAIASVVDEGNIVLVNFDESSNDRLPELLDELQQFPGAECRLIESVYQNQYIAQVDFEGCEGYQAAEGFVDFFNNHPEFLPGEEEAEFPLLLGSIEDDEEIDRLWKIYNSRFEYVSERSVTEAAFDESEFKRILRDPGVVKAVHMQDNKVVNLMLFMTDLSDASWLREEYYQQYTQEAYETNNLLLFLGVVSDPDAEGSMHMLSPISLLTRVGQARQSSVAITFECNEVSAKYLPGLVKFAIEQTGFSRVSGLDEPVSQSRFMQISKS